MDCQSSSGTHSHQSDITVSFLKMTVFTWFRDFVNPKNFIEAQRPIIAVTFLGGLTPFKVAKEQNETVLKCSIFGYVNSFIHTTIFILCYVLAISKRQSVTGYFIRSEISNLGDVLQAGTGIGALIMTFIYSIFLRFKLIEAFHSLARTDQHLRLIGVEINYKKSFYRNNLIIFLQVLVLGTYAAVSSAIVLNSGYLLCLSAWMSFLLPFMMMSMIIILFFSLVDQCQHRFGLLNKVLVSIRSKILEKQMLRYSKKNITEVALSQKPLAMSTVFPICYSEIINHLASIQSELCDACDSVEDHFTLQMLTVVAISFLTSVFDLYYISDKLFTGGSAEADISMFQFVMFFFYQGLVHVIAVMKIVYITSLAIQKV